MNYMYPLGKGTIDNNIELKISLRSIERFDPNCNVVVVGEYPSWANGNLIHIPCPDINPHNRDGNMINKVLKICEYWEGDFVRMSDDHVILNKPDFTPYYYDKLSDIATWDPTANKWQKRAFVTSRYLHKHNFIDHNFDLHCPVLINARQYVDTMNKIDKYYLFHDRGYLINSIYFNMVEFDHVEVPLNHIIRLKSATFDIDFIERFTFLNYKNRSFTGTLKQYLLSKFNKPSRFEDSAIYCL